MQNSQSKTPCKTKEEEKNNSLLVLHWCECLEHFVGTSQKVSHKPCDKTVGLGVGRSMGVMNEILAININDLSKTEKSWRYLMSCKMINFFLLCWTISETHTSQPFGLGNCGTCRPRVSWNNWKCKVNRDEDLREERCWCWCWRCWRCWRRYTWSGGLASQLTGAVLQDPALSPTHRYIASR